MEYPAKLGRTRNSVQPRRAGRPSLPSLVDPQLPACSRALLLTDGLCRVYVSRIASAVGVGMQLARSFV